MLGNRTLYFLSLRQCEDSYRADIAPFPKMLRNMAQICWRVRTANDSSLSFFHFKEQKISLNFIKFTSQFHVFAKKINSGQPKAL